MIYTSKTDNKQSHPPPPTPILFRQAISYLHSENALSEYHRNSWYLIMTDIQGLVLQVSTRLLRGQQMFERILLECFRVFATEGRG